VGDVILSNKGVDEGEKVGHWIWERKNLTYERGEIVPRISGLGLEKPSHIGKEDTESKRSIPRRQNITQA
jgi:hypothetical protein